MDAAMPYIPKNSNYKVVSLSKGEWWATKWWYINIALYMDIGGTCMLSASEDGVYTVRDDTGGVSPSIYSLYVSQYVF